MEFFILLVSRNNIKYYILKASIFHLSFFIVLMN